WGKHGCRPHSQTANDTSYDQLCKIDRYRTSDGRYGKQERGYDQGFLSSDLICNIPGHSYADNTAQNSGRDRPALHIRIEPELGFQKTYGTGNYRRVIAEQKPAQGTDKGHRY